MADEAVTVKGLKELVSTLLELGVNLQDFKAAHLRVSEFVGAEAATRAPRRSGMLAASWRGTAAKTQGAVRFGGGRVPYANAIHWGTGPRPGRRGPHNIRPSLFAVNALNETRDTWMPFYETELASMVARVRGADNA